MAGCTVLIGGDIYPGGQNADAFAKGEVETLFGPIIPALDRADLVVANLESPLTESETPIEKTGPCLRGPPAAAETMKSAGFDAVTLANNHIMDHGTSGLRDTLKALGDAGIEYFGGGGDLASARKPLVVERNGVSVALLGMADLEFSIAGPRRWGACPLDIIWYVRFMREWRDRFDHLIVLLHGGTEHYPLPSPGLQRVARFLVEEGASAVVCQHSHHSGAIEVVNGSPIVYGQGNLIFLNRWRGEQWHRGYLVQLDLEKGCTPSFDILPFQQRQGEPGLRALTEHEERQFREDIDAWSETVGDPEELALRWEASCERRRRMYFGTFLPPIWPFSFLHRHSRIGEWIYGKRAIIGLINLFRCENHRETVITLLNSRYEASFGESVHLDGGEGDPLSSGEQA